MNPTPKILKNASIQGRRTPWSVCLVLSLFASVLTVEAGTLYWQGNGNTTATRQWNTTANWTENATGGGLPNRLPVASAPYDDLVIGNYNATEAVLNTRPTAGKFYANSITFSCNGWLVVNVNSTNDLVVIGAGGIINNPNNVTGAPTVSAPGQIINEFRCNGQLMANATLMNYDINQPLKFRTLDMGTNRLCLDLKSYTLTLDGPGTNNFSTTTPGASGHYGGSVGGTGGVVKNGIGFTTFSATNTYTGPTLVNAGQLSTKTWSMGGGSYSVADSGSLIVTVGSAGTTLNTSSLSLTNSTGAANTNTLIIALTSLGNATAPVVNATNLNLNGTVYLTVTGTGLSPGTISLLKYSGSITGGGTLVTNSLPSGVVGYLTNNTSISTWQLVVSQVPSLVWVGKTNSTLAGNWDIGTTTNWNDASIGLPTYYANGLPVQLNDTGLTNVITLVTNVTPYSLTVSNNTLTYYLTNDGVNGFQINPSAGIIKDGPGVFVLGTTNSYTSFTYIKQGTLRTAVANAIGRSGASSGAALTNNGILDMNGYNQFVGTLAGSGVITNSTSTAITLQSLPTAEGGPFTGRIDEGSGGAITLYKGGGGTLTLSGQNRYSGGTHFMTGGSAATRVITLGGDNVLGTGPVVFDINAILTPDASPRSLTNSVSIKNVNAAFGLGSAGAGALTLSGSMDNSSGIDQTIVSASDVLILGPMTSTDGGYLGKEGTGKMTLKNNSATWYNKTGDARVSDGTLVLDNSALTVIGLLQPTFRVQSLVSNSIASLYITNNGSLTVGNANGYYRLRLGDAASPTNSLGQQTTTNLVDIRGTLVADGVTLGYTSSMTIITNSPGPSETYVTNYNGGGAYARLNLQPGSQVTLNQLSASPTKTVTEVYMNGATINVFDGASSSFLQGLTNVFIQSGGVTMNGQNNSSIHIRQNLLDGGGGGGLTWNGTNDGNGLSGVGIGDAPVACMLQLDGTNTYTGTTLIKVGILGGIGKLASPVVLASGAKIYPGGGGNIGTLTINNSLTLSNAAVCSFDVNTTNAIYQTNELGVVTNTIPLATNDLLVVSGAVTVGGATININNTGPNLVLGNRFQLFNKAAVGFTNVNVSPALDAGLALQDNLAVDGSVQVVAAVVAAPVLGMAQAGNALTFTWTGSGYKLQSQTNGLGAGLGSVWFDYPGGGTSPVGVTIDPANPTVFFRLSQ